MHKINAERTSVQIAYASLVLILLFHLTQRQTQTSLQHQKAQKQILGIDAQKENKMLPMRLIIPSINVDAAIQYVSVTADGAMDVPNNTTDVGWFDLGPLPGEKGSAVIDGHFDSEDGSAGVFTDLHTLKVGDRIYIKDHVGKFMTFIVRQTQTYTPGYAENVFSANDRPHLNLITCDGTWDQMKKNYSKRLVVFTDLTH